MWMKIPCYWSITCPLQGQTCATRVCISGDSTIIVLNAGSKIRWSRRHTAEDQTWPLLQRRYAMWRHATDFYHTSWCPICRWSELDSLSSTPMKSSCFVQMMSVTFSEPQPLPLDHISHASQFPQTAVGFLRESNLVLERCQHYCVNDWTSIWHICSGDLCLCLQIQLDWTGPQCTHNWRWYDSKGGWNWICISLKYMYIPILDVPFADGSTSVSQDAKAWTYNSG